MKNRKLNHAIGANGDVFITESTCYLRSGFTRRTWETQIVAITIKELKVMADKYLPKEGK